MLRSTKELDQYAVSATDGDIGHVRDLYFDDDAWVVRYFVVNAGSWLNSRMVLISPIAVNHPKWSERALPVSITKEQVKNSPDIDTDQPVSRQNEEQYLGYYGYGNYWGGGGLWGEGLYPYPVAPDYLGRGVDRDERIKQDEAYLRAEKARHRNDNPHLRSCKAVAGYRIEAKDGEIGHVSDFLVDDDTWAIRYLVVDTAKWWGGHKVLVAPRWVTGVHWSDQTVSVSVSRESVKGAPPYDPDKPWTADHDLSLYRHHGRTGYWAGGSVLESEI